MHTGIRHPDDGLLVLASFAATPTAAVAAKPSRHCSVGDGCATAADVQQRRGSPREPTVKKDP